MLYALLAVLLALAVYAAKPYVSWSRGCAWRSFFVHYGNVVLFGLGFDPNISDGLAGPNLFGYFNDEFWRIRFRKLGWMKWSYKGNFIQKKMYRWQEWFLHGMDARYGWGSGRR